MRRTSILAVCLACVLLFSACTAGGNALSTYQPTQSAQTQPTEESTEPKSILDEIRTETFSDISSDSVAYDTACYMVYYDIMKAKDGAFLPYAMLTRAEGAEMFCNLTGKTLTQELERQTDPLTRAELVVMLYETAKELGVSTETSLTELTYLDVTLTADTEYAWKEAVLWAVENDLLSTFVGDRLLPDTAVSRLQLAQTIVALKALDEKDEMAQLIWETIPEREDDSVALTNHDAIETIVNSVAQKYGAKGLQVAVVENGVVTDTYAYGWAVKDKVAMTADHKLRVASISKVAVGLTAQLLREDGIVDLDADISQYWGITVKNPKYPLIPITVRNMLTHTSSIVNAGDSVPRTYSSVRSKLQGGGFVGSAPGDINGWTYNNYAFGVLGMTLELAANRVTDDILQEKLYKAMDIDAAFGAGDIKNTDMLATLYRTDWSVARTVEAQKKLHSPTKPGAKGSYFAGGLTASAYDLAKLMALLGGDGKYEGVQLLQPDSVAEMETYMEPATPDGSYQAQPMRYWPELYGRDGIFFHTGSAYGVFNAVTYDPTTGDGVVVLSTGASGAKDEFGIYKVCAEINAEIYKIIQ